MRGRALLLALLVPTLAHFFLDGGRINGDGVHYYVYVRSLMKDADLDFTNEYTHYGLIGREDIAVPTRTGMRRSIFAVGPALAWVPFFALGELAARASSLLAPVDLSGYGPFHVTAVALGSLLLGFGAVLFIHAVLARHFDPGVATLAAAAIWLATFLYWYMVQQPTMSHAPSAFGAALVVWLWDRGREGRGARGFALLGLAIGFAMCLRWQNALLGLLPLFDLALAVRDPARRRTAFAGAMALGAAALLGALPQMAAWKVLYGEWVLRYPPHGADFLRLGRPFVLETLFSSRHGLLWWTPLLWLGYLGLAPLVRRRRALGLAVLAPVALMTYVNMCSGDWWAGGSFSNRRFDSLLPLLALGLAASLEWMAALVARRPALAPMAIAAAAAAWNVALAEGTRARPAPRPIAFADALSAGARRVSMAAGSPPSWPASWIFAAREGLPAEQYDRLVGRYLFYRQNNLQGRIDLASADDALLGEGWGPAAEHDGRAARTVAGWARVIAPLDVAEDLDLALDTSADAPATLRIRVNGRPAGDVAAGAGWTPQRLSVPSSFWRRDLNDVAFEADAPVWIDALQFTRAGAADRRERGFEAR